MSGGMRSVRAVDRLVVILLGLLLTVAAFTLLLHLLGQGQALTWLVDNLGGSRWQLVLTSLVMLFFAIYLFWMGLRRRRQIKTILCETPLGEVRIAERAVESLAVRATRRVKGVQDAAINVRATTAGLDVFVETTVGPDQSIPQITQEIRSRVADYIRETVGVSVNTVAVLVTRVAPDNRARVE